MAVKGLVTKFSVQNILYKSVRLFLQSKRNLNLAPCKQCRRHISTSTLYRKSVNSPIEWSNKYESVNPEFDWNYLCDPTNTSILVENIKRRKGVGDIEKVVSLWTEYNKETQEKKRICIWKELIESAKELPNTHHPNTPQGEEENARLVETVGKIRDFNFKPKSVVSIGEDLDILRTGHVYLGTGPRTYYFKQDLVDLEQALIKFTLEKLKKEGFALVSVPDLIYSSVIQDCGFNIGGNKHLVYKFENEPYKDVCLSGTSEMALAGVLCDEVLNQSDLPLKLTAVSNCYRRESASIEPGIYRVHQFTKIEMFGVSSDESGEESEELLQYFVNIERSLFSQLGLHFRILEMPSECLGAPAYRKYDMEAWMPAHQFWGEISSASNCTDYQSRRLGVKYQNNKGSINYSHTVNGTACAVPRMLMAILENYQQSDGTVEIPEVLQPYMNNKTQLSSHHHTAHYIKHNKLIKIYS